MLTNLLKKLKSQPCPFCGAANKGEQDHCHFCQAPLAGIGGDSPANGSSAKSNIPVTYLLRDSFFQTPKLTVSRNYQRFYLRILMGVVGVIALVILITSLTFYQATARETATFERILNLTAQQGKAPEKLSDIIGDKKDWAPHIAKAIQETQTTQFLQRINQAYHEPTYQLQIEAFGLLLNQQDQLSEFHRKRIAQSKKTLEDVVAVYSSYLDLSKGYLEKEYFNAAIRNLGYIVARGPRLGPIYQDSYELLSKTYDRRIAFYIVRNNLPLARKSIAEARYFGIKSARLSQYDKQITQLEKLGYRPKRAPLVTPRARVRASQPRTRTRNPRRQR